MTTLITMKPIIAKCENFISEFIQTSTTGFAKELDLYISKNNDPTVLGYSNEQTLVSLFSNGLIRENLEITTLQEYKTYTKNSESPKRPDLFINYHNAAIWAEGKIDTSFSFETNHWKVRSWLEWDNTHFNQVMKYYENEGSFINATYHKGHFIMTLCFKLIKNNPELFIREAIENLGKQIDEQCSRPWYYTCAFVKDTEEKGSMTGVEIYGTIERCK